VIMPWGMKGWTGREDDPSYLSPFAQELYAGYMRFQSIDDGTMWSMLNPGAEGVGLHVGHLFDPECCCGYYGDAHMQAVYKNDNNPWLFPSLVTWKSIMVNEFPHTDFIKNFDIDYPAVALTHVNSAIDEFRWSINNVNYETETDRMSYYPNDDRIQVGESNVIGLAPLWSVVPMFTQERTIALQKSIRKLQTETDLGMLSECWCTIDGFPCDDSCARSTDYRAACTCNIYEQISTKIENLYRYPIKVEDYMDDMTKQTWQSAVNRFYDGWQVIADTAHQGEVWASYWQQAQSPFSGLPGQSFRDLQALTA